MKFLPHFVRDDFLVLAPVFDVRLRLAEPHVSPDSRVTVHVPGKPKL